MTEQRAARLLFALVVAGYPLFGLLAALLNVDSVVLSVPYRLIVLALSGWLLGVGTGRHVPSMWVAFFWIFLLLYAVRLLWDLGAGVPEAAGSLAYFTTTVLIPVAALARTDLRGQEPALSRQLVLWGGGASLLAVGMQALGLGQSRSLTEQVGRLFFEAVNPITLAHAAVTSLLAMMCLLRHRPGVAWKVFMAGLAIGAVACLALTASRAPALVLVTGGIVYAVATGRWRLLALVAVAGAFLVQDQFATLQERFTNLGTEEAAVERLLLQTSALAQFADHPILGSAHVEPLMRGYPHNLPIETLMAMGVSGMVVLLPLIVCACWRALRLLRQGELLLALLFWQFFLAAQLSGSIYGNAAFWSVVMLALRATPGQPESAGLAEQTN